MKLAVSGIMLGILLMISAVVYSMYGLPTSYRSGNMTVYVMPNTAVSSLHFFISLVGFILGLMVTVAGAIGLLRARSTRSLI